jgi:hypothetical protein
MTAGAPPMRPVGVLPALGSGLTDLARTGQHERLLGYDLTHYAAAFERVYTLGGRLLRNRRIVVNPPAPSQEEIREAFDIVRADAEMGRILHRFTGQLEGGFLIEEGRGKACGPGARCLLIQILSRDRAGLIRVMGVDLVKQSIAYRTFLPSEHPGIK